MTFLQLYNNTDVQHRLWSESFRWPRLPRFITLSLRPFVMSLKKRKQKCAQCALAGWKIQICHFPTLSAPLLWSSFGLYLYTTAFLFVFPAMDLLQWIRSISSYLFIIEMNATDGIKDYSKVISIRMAVFIQCVVVCKPTRHSRTCRVSVVEHTTCRNNDWCFSVRLYLCILFDIVTFYVQLFSPLM